MNADQMGNFIAGFEGAMYDAEYFNTTGGGNAEGAVMLGGVIYHLVGATKAKNDPLDRTGMPDIVNGERFGWKLANIGWNNVLSGRKDVCQ